MSLKIHSVAFFYDAMVFFLIFVVKFIYYVNKRRFFP